MVAGCYIDSAQFDEILIISLISVVLFSLMSPLASRMAMVDAALSVPVLYITELQ